MKFALAAASLLIFCSAASAQTVASGRHERDPACKAAIENVCPGIKPGDGRIKACLKEHNTSFRQLCPQDAKPGKRASAPVSTVPVPSAAPLATPPAGQ